MGVGNVGFGTWLGAAAVVAVGIGILDTYDRRLAWGAAIVILLAVFLRYPAAVAQIGAMFGYRNPLPPHERT